ncbi:MAG: HAD family hydrolase [Acidimicrobiia bacterium]
MSSVVHPDDVGRPDRVGEPPTPTPLAIFDLDRTILPGSSLAIAARELVRFGLIGRTAVIRAGVENLAFRYRGASDRVVAALVSDVLALTAGLDASDVRAVLERSQAAMVSSSRWELIDRIRAHRAAGDVCVVLTASPVEIAEMFAESLGAHFGIGTRAEIVDGRYTGRLVGSVCYGQAKLLHLERGPVRPLWHRSTAYSDAISDLPLLAAVGTPIVVNPDRKLRRVARTRRWDSLTISR